MRTFLSFFALLIFTSLCTQKAEGVFEDSNPPADGFNLASSDTEAIEIADMVMQSMGGRKAWDHTRFLKWNFFGARKLLWDKQTGWVRIEDQRSDLKINVNVYANPLEGSVSKNGEIFSETDSINYYLNRGNRIWINDSYWLVMPYKLKDTGVKLTYASEDTLLTGESADKLRLTFDAVGVTPQNAYYVWVAKSDTLVRQWAYYREASDSVPGFIYPWNDYQTYGKIKLSGNRGERGLSEIEVLEEVDASFFTSFENPI